jgi:hypothetical protein
VIRERFSSSIKTVSALRPSKFAVIGVSDVAQLLKVR